MQYKSKAVRMTEVMKKDIWEGCFARDKYLPSEQFLAERYHTSRLTLRRMVDLLVQEGVLLKVANHGIRIHPELKLPNASDPVCHKPENPTIAALMDAFPDGLTIEISRGIQCFAAANQLNFVLLQNTEGPQKLMEEISKLREQRIAGLIVLLNGHRYDRIMTELAADKFPLVAVNSPVSSLNIPCVEVDNLGGAYTAVSALLRQARRPVVYLGDMVQCHTQLQRHRGYARAMTDFGFDSEIDRHTIRAWHDVDRNDYLAANKEQELAGTIDTMLDKFGPSCSIMAENDYLARAVYAAAARQKLTIGKDVMICGFDDLPLAEMLSPPLSTVRQPRFAIGYEAARLLADIIDGRSHMKLNRLLPVQFIERASSATTGAPEFSEPDSRRLRQSV